MAGCWLRCCCWWLLACWRYIPTRRRRSRGGAGTGGAVRNGDPRGTGIAVEEEPVPEEPWGPVAESAPVDDSYFDDVAFVGDSRTDGFRLYSGLDRGTYFCVTGETVASATELENWKGENGKKVSLAEAVAAADCGKIYLMLGVNELGWKGTDIFRGHAENLIRRLKADHPDAELVIQSLLPVSTEQDAKGSYVNNNGFWPTNVWRSWQKETAAPM